MKKSMVIIGSTEELESAGFTGHGLLPGKFYLMYYDPVDESGIYISDPSDTEEAIDALYQSLFSGRRM